jgi:hypothetical protein
MRALDCGVVAFSALASPLATSRLHAHPQAPCDVVDDVIVDIAVARFGVLVVRYAIVGALDRLRIPAPGASLDADRLWAHTCCELFIAPAGGEAYVEWNFSPTGQVAQFAFSAYRKRSPHPSAPTSVAGSAVTANDRELRLEARVPLPPDRGDAARISLSAVLEDASGALSYWALRHPCDRPDFHHPDGFALALTFGRQIAIVQR